MTNVRMVEKAKTSDSEIRRALISYLSGQSNKVIEEFSVESGISRADLVGLSETEMHAYEIKSDRDTLTRLRGQVHSYNKVFTRVTLVVGESHIIDSIYAIPNWWGVILAKKGEDGKVIFSHIRKASINPSTDAASMLRLLFKEEISVVMKSYSTSIVVSDTKERLTRALLSNMDDRSVREVVTSTLLQRYCA